MLQGYRICLWNWCVHSSDTHDTLAAVLLPSPHRRWKTEWSGQRNRQPGNKRLYLNLSQRWGLTRERMTKMNAIRKHQKPMSSGLTWDWPLKNHGFTPFRKPLAKVSILWNYGMTQYTSKVICPVKATCMAMTKMLTRAGKIPPKACPAIMPPM